MEREHPEFNAFYLAHYRRVYQLVYCWVAQDQDTQNIAHDVFTEFFEHYKTLPKQSWTHWIYNKARNKRKSFMRGEQRRKNREHEFQKWKNEFQKTAPDQLAERRELLRMALQNIPEEKAELLELYYVANLNFEEIATVLGISPSSLPKLLARTRKYFSRSYLALAKGDSDAV